jgi:3-hydroxyisobutyrate dehydrogenase
MALACKDLGLSIDLARSVGVPTELSALVEQIYRRAKACYGERAGEMSPFRLYEDLIGADLRLPPLTALAGEPGVEIAEALGTEDVAAG